MPVSCDAASDDHWFLKMSRQLRESALTFSNLFPRKQYLLEKACIHFSNPGTSTAKLTLVFPTKNPKSILTIRLRRQHSYANGKTVVHSWQKQRNIVSVYRLELFGNTLPGQV